MNYYKYTAKTSGSFNYSLFDCSSDNAEFFGCIPGTCWVGDNTSYFGDYIGDTKYPLFCKFSSSVKGCDTYGYIPYAVGTTFYCSEKPTYYGFNNNLSFDGEYSLSIPGSNNSYFQDSVKFNKVYVTSEQTADMGTSLVQGGAGLLHIGIQILPYAISFIIILIIFGLIKNWSKLKNSFNNYKIYRKYKVPYKEYRNQTGGSRKEYRSWVKKTFKKF